MRNRSLMISALLFLATLASSPAFAEGNDAKTIANRAWDEYKRTGEFGRETDNMEVLRFLWTDHVKPSLKNPPSPFMGIDWATRLFFSLSVSEPFEASGIDPVVETMKEIPLVAKIAIGDGSERLAQALANTKDRIFETSTMLLKHGGDDDPFINRFAAALRQNVSNRYSELEGASLAGLVSLAGGRLVPVEPVVAMLRERVKSSKEDVRFVMGQITELIRKTGLAGWSYEDIFEFKREGSAFEKITSVMEETRADRLAEETWRFYLETGVLRVAEDRPEILRSLWEGHVRQEIMQPSVQLLQSFEANPEWLVSQQAESLEEDASEGTADIYEVREKLQADWVETFFQSWHEDNVPGLLEPDLVLETVQVCYDLIFANLLEDHSTRENLKLLTATPDRIVTTTNALREYFFYKVDTRPWEPEGSEVEEQDRLAREFAESFARELERNLQIGTETGLAAPSYFALQYLVDSGLIDPAPLRAFLSQGPLSEETRKSMHELRQVPSPKDAVKRFLEAEAMREIWFWDSSQRDDQVETDLQRESGRTKSHIETKLQEDKLEQKKIDATKANATQAARRGVKRIKKI